MYIASEHIQQWVRTGKAKVVPLGIALQFGEYLNQFPWLPGGSGLDWSHMKGHRVTLSTLTKSQTSDSLRATPLSRDPFLVFWYVADQPCIACDTEFGISNIDQAFWKAPGKRYLFGASIRDGLVEPVMSHFAEYDGADTLIAAQQP